MIVENTLKNKVQQFLNKFECMWEIPKKNEIS